MSLHNGLDCMAIATLGVFSKTYGAVDTDNTADLFASMGYLEDAPTAYSTIPRKFYTTLKDCLINLSTFGNGI